MKNRFQGVSNSFQVVSNNFDFQFEVIKNDMLTKDPNFPRAEFKVQRL